MLPGELMSERCFFLLSCVFFFVALAHAVVVNVPNVIVFYTD